MNTVYLTAAGKFLPGLPISNDEIENYLGCLFDKPSKTRSRILRQNGIISRYYAMDRQQHVTHTVSGMTAAAIGDCLQRAGIGRDEIGFLAAATTQGDLPVPGFASMVHGDAGLGRCAIDSHQSVCAAGMMAIRSAWLTVRAGEADKAVACAGELASRMFKAKRFEGQTDVRQSGRLSPETDFLRWMLSDGAGAFLLENRPVRDGISLRVDWIDIRSHAHLFDVCMYAGINKAAAAGSWLNYDSFSEADRDSAINLKQDLRLVKEIVPLGVQHFFQLVEDGRIDPGGIDWLLCHYSSEYFRPAIVDLLKKGGVVIPPEKWFSNLATRGNTGSASIFLMVEELLYSGRLKEGQTLLCMVPESGRFITTFMRLTVVGAESETGVLRPVVAPAVRTDGDPVQEWLVRQLVSVWIDFETGLRRVPIVAKIDGRRLTMEDYKLLLLNLRQQVIDGSQWIARAASNVSIDFFDIRSAFIAHSRDEHRDYQLLEKNYFACGGTKDELYQGKKNIGSEALSAYMFHKASQPDPFDLLGGMFIIEGLGNRLAGDWGRSIRDQLGLEDGQVSFFLYHETSDANDNHFERFEKAIASGLLDRKRAEGIVKTAKVVARLYTMQLQELGNY